MPWLKREMILKLTGRGARRISHAQCPTPLRIDDDTIRIYYGSRDAQNRTLPAFIDVDAQQPARIVDMHKEPVMDLGALGAFDDSGVMPSCVLRVDGRVLLYYAGWNTSTTVPYRISIGLAASDDGGRTFERVFDGPILERCAREPHFCSTPFVLCDGKRFRMWYLSCVDWGVIDGQPEPHYVIRAAESADGLDWTVRGRIALSAESRDECLARPWVIKSGNQWEMWFCRRSRSGYRTDKSKSYRIARAESADGRTWSRCEAGGLEVSPKGWDAEMTAYPAVYEHRGVRHLLYNGNEFGRNGFGHAVWDDE